MARVVCEKASGVMGLPFSDCTAMPVVTRGSEGRHRNGFSGRGRVGNFAERATCEVNLQVRYTGMYSSSSLPRVGVPSCQIGVIIADLLHWTLALAIFWL